MPKHQPSKRGFGQNCGCVLHEPGASKHSTAHLFSSTKLLSQSSRAYILEQEYIKPWSKFICEKCIKLTVSLQQEEQTKGSKLSPQGSESVPQEEDELKNNSFDTSSSKAHLKFISDCIEKDIKELSRQQSPTLDDLSTYSAKSWLDERPSVLVALLKSICDINTLDDKRSYLIAKVVEQLYHIRNPRLTLPLSERESILCYSLTSSKIFANFQAHTSPSSSYWHLVNTLDQSASSPIPFPPGVVRYAFDNNQVVGKTYIIRGGDNNVPTSIITSSIYAELNNSKLQYRENLKPTHWMFKEPTPEQEHQIIALSDRYNDFFRDSRDHRIESTIADVLQEHSKDGDTDHIDEQVKNQRDSENFKLCLSCGGENVKTFRVCRNCKGPLIKQTTPNIETNDEQRFNVYECFNDVNTNVNDATVIPGEPDFVNPNSFETISLVLRNVGKRSGISEYGGSRQWLFIECDGHPYVIVRNLIDNVWKCSECHASFYNRERYIEHYCYILKEVEGYREFQWIVPVVGLLHLEMNAARSFLKLNWSIFISDIAFVLGFKSEKAQQYCQRGSDHHKTWELLEILYAALSKELLVPYVKQCADAGTKATVEGYWSWCESVVDFNYRYIQQMTFTFLHSLMMFRTGVRRNNKYAIDAAKNKFAPLFYAQHHPKYQQILFRDMMDEVNMPDELKVLIASCYTMSRTQHDGHYQGGDALLEEGNKEGKSWLKVAGGVPDAARWTRIYRNLTKLKKIRESTMKDVGLEEKVGAARPSRALQKEVILARAAIRKEKYLSSPMESEKGMTSLGGSSDVLDDLVDFSVLSKECIVTYFRSHIHGEGSVMTELCATRSERDQRDKLQTMSCKELQGLIRAELLKLQPRSAADFTAQYARLCGGGSSKADHITLYYSLLEEIEISEAMA